VYASISLHVLSSVAKRVLELSRLREQKRSAAASTEGYEIKDANEVEASTSTKKIGKSTLHTITGFLLIPVVTIHSYVNRISPSSSKAPIKEYSPSELDYSYVTYGFLTSSKSWRYITWTLYCALLAAGAAHVVGGTDIIAKRFKARREMKATKKEGASLPLASDRLQMKRGDVRMRKQRKALINGAVTFAGAAWLAVGIAKMASEDTSHASAWMTKRVSVYSTKMGVN
jgi:hypothetical protein